MIKPTSLQKGDRVRLVATARKITRVELAPALRILRGWGLQVDCAPHLYADQNQLAGSDEERRSDLQAALDDPQVKAIFCVRGGYGTVRIIDALHWEAFAQKPKWLVGYSDVTVLHNRISQLGVQSLHATMPINFAQNTAASLASLHDALWGEAPTLKTPAHRLNRYGSASGEITGGNLSMLYSQTGSPTALDTRGKILFFEDLDEYLYHIDRMLYNLRRNGYFSAPAAVMVGGLTDMNDNQVPWGESAEEIVARHLAEAPFPLAFGWPAGHVDDHRSLIFGRKAQLTVGANGSSLFYL